MTLVKMYVFIVKHKLGVDSKQAINKDFINKKKEFLYKKKGPDNIISFHCL